VRVARAKGLEPQWSVELLYEQGEELLSELLAVELSFAVALVSEVALAFEGVLVSEGVLASERAQASEQPSLWNLRRLQHAEVGEALAIAVGLLQGYRRRSALGAAWVYCPDRGAGRCCRHYRGQREYLVSKKPRNLSGENFLSKRLAISLLRKLQKVSRQLGELIPPLSQRKEKFLPKQPGELKPQFSQRGAHWLSGHPGQ